jgi:NAD(P)-dependent dehydrogenase (short-subunit alcohol dehydrogenase family)
VRVNLLSPGLVPHEHAASDAGDAARLTKIPLGRAQTPEEVARAAAFLCSNEASHTTGADLPVSGGWML